MSSLLEPPAERDMPRGRSTRMRAHLLASIQRPPSRSGVGRRRVAMVIVMAAATAVAGVAASTWTFQDDGEVEALAMSTAELSPPLREVTRQCLEWNARQRADGAAGVPAVRAGDLAMAARRDRRAVTMFLTPTGYFSCDVHGKGGGGAGGEDWPSRDWVPGPVQMVSNASTELDSGHVMAAGRVSNRVHRLVLDHGNGLTTTARIERGVFGLISRGVVTKEAEMVSYQVDGSEIGRRPLFQPLDHYDHCYVDPSGNVLYGDPGPNCLPAEPWAR